MLTHMIARLLAAELPSTEDMLEKDSATDGPGFDPTELPIQLFTHRLGIVEILNIVTTARQPVRLMAPGIARPDQTRIMSFDAESGELLVRQLVNEDQHAALMQSRYVNISTLYEGTPLLFSMHVMGTRRIESVPCYLLRQPSWLMRIQMRGFVRVKLPKHVLARLHWAPTNQASQDAQVLDLSESGVGFLFSPHGHQRLEVGSSLKLVDLEAKDIELLALHLVVKRISPTADGDFLVGASIHTRSESQRRRLRQYLMLHQRSQSVAE